MTTSYIPFYFLELALLMNIAKWMYFFLVVKIHRNIRHYEINMEILVEREGHYEQTNCLGSDKPTFKQLMLNKLKKNSFVIYLAVGTVAIALTIVYSYFQAKFSIYIYSKDVDSYLNFLKFTGML